MLFNFQGPRCLVDSLFILAHRFLFVNTFLKTFLKFFCVDLKNRFAMRFSGGLSSALSDSSPERLNIISHSKPIVNTFFCIFLGFFIFPHISTAFHRFSHNPSAFQALFCPFSSPKTYFLPSQNVPNKGFT